MHAHTDIWTLPFADSCSVPTVVTMHGRLDLDVVRTVLPMYPDTPLVSISDHQRRAVADLPLRWMATCPNGLDLSAYFAEPSTCPTGDYLAFVGRITPEKRPDWAVEVAVRAGRPLRVAAKVDPLDVDYWHEQIEPLFAAYDVDFVGEIGEADKPAFFGGAAATLFPIDWPEPFGLVMIESLASGTPVIALRNGSVPEVLSDGQSGFVCDSLDEMVDAVERLHRTAARRVPRRGRPVHRRVDGRGLPERLRGSDRRARVPSQSSRPDSSSCRRHRPAHDRCVDRRRSSRPASTRTSTCPHTSNGSRHRSQFHTRPVLRFATHRRRPRQRNEKMLVMSTPRENGPLSTDSVPRIDRASYIVLSADARGLGRGARRGDP